MVVHGDPTELALPASRRLRTYAFDPMSSRLSGRFLVIEVPYEANLAPGPMGDMVHVVDFDHGRDTWYSPVDLNAGSVLAQDGVRPSESDPRSHQQIVYAVAMSVIARFEEFMGRRFRWKGNQVLRLVPHAFEGRNAFFDPKRQAVLFGYYPANLDDPGSNLPGQVIFTCLSNDIIAHEVTHALVHRLRRFYAEATNPDVFALHEALADLVALFQHFAHRAVVIDAIATTSGDLRSNSGLLELAREFGESTGRGAALRSALRKETGGDEGEGAVPRVTFATATEPHDRGACFVVAVFDAYLNAYQAAIADLLRIATGGTGVLPPGRLHPDLVTRVADEAIRTADRILRMVVRSFDYMPVVDPTFGDLVRAIVTADRELYPDDAGMLRGRLVESLRHAGIYPTGVASLSDESLSWSAPGEDLRLNDDESLIDLSGILASATRDLDVGSAAGEMGARSLDPSVAADGAKKQRPHAGQVLYETFAEWAGRHALVLGLDPSASIGLAGVHVSYRQASDRQPRPEIVVQLSQRRGDLEDQALDPNRRAVVRAGTTIIARADGVVTYVVAKPFPLADASALDALPDNHPARDFHTRGLRRLKALRAWVDVVEESDPVSAWTDEPAMWRLDFAALHAEADREGCDD
jgi:hypothetical protein